MNWWLQPLRLASYGFQQKEFERDLVAAIIKVKPALLFMLRNEVGRGECQTGFAKLLASVESLGKNGEFATVEEVRVKNCTLTNTTNGVRIKTYQNGLGYARKISFEDIKMVDSGTLLSSNRITSARAKSKKNRLQNMDRILMKMVFQTCIYHIWKEINARRQQTGYRSVDQVVQAIDKAVRNRITSLRYKADHQYAGLMSRWFEVTA
ncbi:hypothetical protein F2Q69_00044693 [Brassica cretica]|uniref:Uncharacterized protein n=1 Tax=Brassica cretica TaxID=69181 RepID=A0A8S9NLP9_BRACR|nr:hypothetical protein F2Q69_00044693 [Brassica cretica]